MSPQQEAAIRTWNRAQLLCRRAYNRARVLEEATPEQAAKIRKTSYSYAANPPRPQITQTLPPAYSHRYWLTPAGVAALARAEERG